jgi:hypothetical protein
MPFVTTMVLVTTSVRSGRVSRFPLVRCIARAVCRQPQPVGLWSAWRMRNKLRKICTHHRLEDRLRGTTRTNHRGYHTPIRTTEQSLADSPRCTLSGSREGESLPGGAQRSPPTTSITSQITTVEYLIRPGYAGSPQTTRCPQSTGLCAPTLCAALSGLCP